MHYAQLSAKHIAHQVGMQAAYSAPMSADSFRHAARRTNLALLVALPKIGGVTQLARLLGKPKLKSHLSNVKSGKRGLGDDLAADIEDAAGLPRGWMDQHHPDSGEPLRRYAVDQISGTHTTFHDLPLLT